MLVVLGLCLGSFVNALVWRLHEQEKGQKSKSKGRKSTRAQGLRPSKDLSIIQGRSMCPHCEHELSALDLIPVVSWLTLRGRCRYCPKPISWQYPFVELFTAVLFVFSYLFWPLAWNAPGVVSFSVWLILLTGFVALAVYDLHWMILPNRIIFPLMYMAAGLVIYLAAEQKDVGILLAAGLSVLIAGGLFYGLFIMSKGRWIGGGDVKLGFLLGLAVQEPAQAFLIIFLASGLGTLVVVPGMALKKVTSKSRIPFGPFLIAGAIIVRLFGAGMIAWYKRQLLLP